MKNLFGRKFSLRDLILFVFMPIVAAGILLSGILSYALINREVRQLTSNNARGVVSQSARFMQERLSDLFREFVLLERTYHNLEYKIDDETGRLNDQFYLELYDQLFSTYSSYYNMLSTVYVGVQYPDGGVRSTFYSEEGIDEIQLDFENGQIGDIRLDSQQARGYCWTIGGVNTVLPRRGDEQDTVRLFRVVEGRSGIKGLLYFEFKERYFAQTLDEGGYPQGMYLAVADRQGLHVFGQEGPALLLKVDDQLQTLEGESGIAQLQAADEPLLCIYETIQLPDWKLTAVIDEEELFAFTGTILYIFLLVFLLVMVLALALTYLSSRLITRPIARWVDKVENLRAGQLDVTFEESACLELSQLGGGLTHMIETVNRLLRDIETEHEKKRALEFKLLQEQINPHFLYNTLYSIQQLYDMGEGQDASEMMAHLASFFRLSLAKGREVVELRHEQAHIRDYMEIQRARHENLSYQMEFDPEVLDCQIVKLTLQPLVENAVSHGLYDQEGGTILVKAGLEGNDLVVEVRDNGVGIAPEQLVAIRRAIMTGDWEQLPESYGIRNVHERLRLRYGAPYGLWLESRPGETIATVRIPADWGPRKE